MNEDAKKEIHRMLEQAFSKYMFVGAQLEPMLVAAMEWAYADAARICNERGYIEYGADGETFVHEENIAIELAKAILERAK